MPIVYKGAPIVDYKNVKLLEDMFLKMEKFCHQELQIFLKKNKENYHYQLKELET